MRRRIDIENQFESLNSWVRRSILLFREQSYLDNIQAVYPFEWEVAVRITEDLRRQIRMAHVARDAARLIELLCQVTKFPYDEPVWFMLTQVQGCMDRNPQQASRIAHQLFEMTVDELMVRIESAPSLNTQIGPMFTAWSRRTFSLLNRRAFQSSTQGVHLLDCTEEEGKSFVEDVLRQQVSKRPDLIAKSGTVYVIGEAKWIGQPGGNQTKQVGEVLEFCSTQRGRVRRIGIIDGYPWAMYKTNGSLMPASKVFSGRVAEH
jgi:hypothetical protein